MSDRTSFRSRGHGGGGGGGGGVSRGGGHRGGRGGSGGGGGGGGSASHHQSGSGPERPKKENILNLDKYMDKEIMVKFNGGREGKTSNFPLPAPLSFIFSLRAFCLSPPPSSQAFQASNQASKEFDPTSTQSHTPPTASKSSKLTTPPPYKQ